MRERAGRDVVDAGCRDRRDRVQRDAARGLQHDAARRRAAPPRAASRCPCCRAARRRRGRLSSTSRSWSSVSTSISILTRWPAMAARALAAPARMPPATAMWLSLIRIASSRPKRWLKPPPQRTAYFSSARRPGVVLRVQQMRALVPAIASRHSRRSAVAMPERWPTKFSAVRSAGEHRARRRRRSSAAACPRRRASPSRACASMRDVGSRACATSRLGQRQAGDARRPGARP